MCVCIIIIIINNINVMWCNGVMCISNINQAAWRNGHRMSAMMAKISAAIGVCPSVMARNAAEAAAGGK